MKKRTDTRLPYILVVDDEEEILQMLDLSLSDSGFAVSTAVSASEALEKIRSGHFDLVVSDINMPDMSGLELLRTVRRKGNKLPFILISGLPDFSIAGSCMKKGTCDYLHKPFSLDDLLKKIGLLLKSESENRAKTDIGDNKKDMHGYAVVKSMRY